MVILLFPKMSINTNLKNLYELRDFRHSHRLSNSRSNLIYTSDVVYTTATESYAVSIILFALLATDGASALYGSKLACKCMQNGCHLL